MAMTSASTAPRSRICPRAKAACSRTSAPSSLSDEISGLHRARVTDLAERERRLLAHVGLRVAQRGDESVDADDIAQLTEREHGLLADVCVGVLHQARQGAGGPLVAQLAERKRRLFADVAVGVLERRDRAASTARASRSCPSAKAACSRTLGLSSLSAPMSPSTARGSRSWLSAWMTLSRTSGVRILQRAHQRLYRPLVAKLRETMRGLLADIRRGILQGLHERLEDRRIAKLHERMHGGLADILVGVLERGRQCRDHSRIGGRTLRILLDMAPTSLPWSAP